MKRFSLLFILVFAVAAFGQEGMEATDEMMAPDSAMTDTMAMDEMMMADTTEAMESGDVLEAMLAEEGTMETEVTSGSALIGYTAGIMAGYPVYMSEGMSGGVKSPVFGLIAATPFGFAVGPFEIGVGIELGMYDFNEEGKGTTFNGIVALATLNTALLETSQGPISAEVGGGYYGASVGFTAGATYSYAVPNVPLVVKPYVRANVTLDGGQDLGGDASNAVSWINAGIYLSYDISTLF